MIKKIHSSEGFTLVELMLAMTVFIAITMLFTAGFIAINRTFARTVIRKQLAESVQVINENITNALRQGNVSTAPVPCSSGDSSCSSPSGEMDLQEWSVLCVGDTRFYWSEAVGSMYVDRQNCEDDDLNAADARALLDERFVVDAFSITPMPVGSARLYSVAGVVRTINRDAFTFDEDDLFQTTCRGSSQSPFAQTCAIEKFSFIVNAQGGGV